MSKPVYSLVAMMTLVCGIGLNQPACGQDDTNRNSASQDDGGMSTEELAQIYGMGVHSYFSGNPSDAEAVLGTAIEAGTQDPRVYYFRGLARLAQKNTEGATEDFTAGAKLEASPDSAPVSVNSSLMRVQGAARLQIEKLRAQAKQEAAEQKQREEQQRYNRIRENEARVLDRGASERFLRNRNQDQTGGGDQQGNGNQGGSDQGGSA